jgi:rubrerythrin
MQDAYENGNVGIQKLKCVSCGTMFMSEIATDKCPSCSEQAHSHREYGSGGMGGCGCGH